MDAVAAGDKGITVPFRRKRTRKKYFLCNNRSLDQTRMQKMDEALLEEWYELESETAIRVWHFNSDYRGRKDMGCLFRKYAPDMEILLSDYCKNIPGDFDLNCIFEDDFE